MEISTCRSCGKLFNYISGQPICPACRKKAEDKFVEVKKYVREHPDIEIKTLSEEMDVSISQIKRWVREERLVFSDDSPIGLPCESCGKTIKTGRYCEACRQKLAMGLGNAAGLNRKPEPEHHERRSTHNKMRFLDN